MARSCFSRTRIRTDEWCACPSCWSRLCLNSVSHLHACNLSAMGSIFTCSPNQNNDETTRKTQFGIPIPKQATSPLYLETAPRLNPPPKSVGSAPLPISAPQPRQTCIAFQSGYSPRFQISDFKFFAIETPYAIIQNDANHTTGCKRVATVNSVSVKGPVLNPTRTVFTPFLGPSSGST